jgi:nucleoside phosphorylase
VLFVAAEWFELRWIPASGESIRVVKSAKGPGPRLAAEAVDSISEPVDVVVSTGLCGALDPKLRVGDIVVASEVNGKPAAAPRTQSFFYSGPLVSVDRVIDTANEKRRLAASGAIAVEMEAAAVAARAAAMSVPFYCIRAVSDTADETFALDLNRARRSDGRFSVPRILFQAFRNPMTGVPELMRLKRNSELAARALGDFVGNCDF